MAMFLLRVDELLTLQMSHIGDKARIKHFGFVAMKRGNVNNSSGGIAQHDARSLHVACLRRGGGGHRYHALCAGVLAVVRSNVAQDRPYTGLTEIRSGEVAEDLASYLVDSEQVRLGVEGGEDPFAVAGSPKAADYQCEVLMGEQANSALALGVSISRDASVRAAGGYLVQVRPNSKSIALVCVSYSTGTA